MSELHQGAGTGGSQDEDSRKRKHSKNCKDSRLRIKNDKMNLASEIAELKSGIAGRKKKSKEIQHEVEMKSLIQEQVRLKIAERQRRVAELEEEVSRGSMQLDGLLIKLVNLGNLEKYKTFTIQSLKNDITVRRQTNWDDWPTEKIELLNKVAELQMDHFKHLYHKTALIEMEIHSKEQGNT